MKKTPLAFLGMLMSLVVAAQSDYRPGFIITNEGDTTAGLINFRNPANNALSCQFKVNEEAGMVEYSPNQLAAYAFSDGQYFVSRQPYAGKNEKLFLEYLINATVDVFFYRDLRAEEHYFVSQDGRKLLELQHGEIESYVNGDKVVRKDTRYIGTLISVFSKSPTIQRRISTGTSLKHKSLINLVKEYHEEVCPNEVCVVYEKKAPEKIRNWGISAGAHHYSFRKKIATLPTRLDFIDQLDYEFPAASPQIGIYYRRSLSSWNSKMFLVYEGGYSQSRFSAKSSDSYFKQSSIMRTIDMTFHYFEQAFMLRYEFPRGKVKPFFAGGVYLDLSMKNDFKMKEQIVFSYNGKTADYNSHNSDPYSTIDFGGLFGIGLLFDRSGTTKDPSLEFRVQGGPGSVLQDDSSYSATIFAALVKIPLKK